MQNNDMDFHVSGGCGQHCQVGTIDCTTAQQEFDQDFEYVSQGYRWFKVNSALHVYMSVTTKLPEQGNGIGITSEVLAYVQLLPSGKFRALRSRNGVNIVMPIPYGTAKEMISLAELYILVERSDKTLRE